MVKNMKTSTSVAFARKALSSVAFPLVALAISGCEKNPTLDKPKAEIVETAPTASAQPTATALAPATVSAAVTGSAAPTASGTAAAGERTVALTPANTKVGFTGSKTGGSHSGTFNKVKGELKLGAKLEDSQLSVEVETSSLHTDSGKLDEHLRSDDFFDVAKFPKASFKVTSIVEAAAKNTTHSITGVMEIKGIKKTIKFPAKIENKDGAIAVRADFVINRKGFRVDSSGITDYLIKDEVLMGINLTIPKP
jgi:polyisoprenoid-binding protein YceI